MGLGKRHATAIGMLGYIGGTLAIAAWFGQGFGLYLLWPILWGIGFLCVIVHELGHVAVALATGGRILAFVAKPFALTFYPFKFHWVGTKGDTEAGGGKVHVQFRNSRHGKHWGWFASAGPLANILLTAAASTFALVEGRLSLATSLATATAIISLSLAVGNLVPFGNSDGAQLGRLVRLRRLSLPPQSPKRTA